MTLYKWEWLAVQPYFVEIRSITSDYSVIYTDGSKDGDRQLLAIESFKTQYHFILKIVETNKTFYFSH